MWVAYRDFAFFRLALGDVFSAIASRTSALNAASSTSSPSWMSIARRTFPSRLELNKRFGSLSDAPLAKGSFTKLFDDSPVKLIPSCDHTGVPIHFHSSTTSGSAALISLRILPRVFPRQSPRLAIRSEMSLDADSPSLPADFFMCDPSSSDPVPQSGRDCHTYRSPSRSSIRSP